MQTNRQTTLLIVLIALAIVVFGGFVLVMLTRQPTDQQATATPAATAEAGEAEATSAAETSEASPEATSDEEPAATETQAGEPASTATAEAPAGEATAETTTEATTSEDEATPTSMSRVNDSLLIGTQVTPALEATVPAAGGEANAEGTVTPTSLSRVNDSLLIGTQVTPSLAESPEGNGSAGDEQNQTEEGATPTSMSRVQASILIGTQVTPALRSSPDSTAANSAENTGDNAATPTSMSQEQSSNVGAEATEEATPETTSEAAGQEAAALPPPDQGSSQSLPAALAVQQNTPSALEPRGPVAERQAALWWIMLGLGIVIYLFVMSLVTAVFVRRRATSDALSDRGARWFIAGGGVVLPVVVLTFLFILSVTTLNVFASTNRPTELTIEVTGHRWWWHVRYPDYEFVTANEIHIPVGQSVRFELQSVDVIHSFWVPQLGGKMDLIPGRTNVIWLEADEAGAYRGLCAEFCGIQHANMAFWVVAEAPEEFEQWIETQQQPAQEPEAELAARGQDVFLNSQCIACHTVRGTNAGGVQGPDLTHFGSRLSIGAGTLPNTRGHLAGWIVDSQGVKPGNLMPPQDVGGQDLQALITYLESLQ